MSPARPHLLQAARSSDDRSRQQVALPGSGRHRWTIDGLTKPRMASPGNRWQHQAGMAMLTLGVRSIPFQHGHIPVARPLAGGTQHPEHRGRGTREFCPISRIGLAAPLGWCSVCSAARPVPEGSGAALPLSPPCLLSRAKCCWLNARCRWQAVKSCSSLRVLLEIQKTSHRPGAFCKHPVLHSDHVSATFFFLSPSCSALLEA